MIGKRFTYRISHSDVLKTADWRFQNGHRVNKMAARSVFAPFPRFSLTGQQKRRPDGGFSHNGEFFAHRNALNMF